jgi:O-acetyl-ADP-ribose deacetylase (regulator of RNase III)
MLKRKVEGIKFIICQEPILSVKSNILFNWTVPELSSGDAQFIEMHKEGGSAIYKECQGQLVKYGKKNDKGISEIMIGAAVLTTAGILNFKKIVHCVIPNFRIREENENKLGLFLNVVNYAFTLIDEYSKTRAKLRRIALLSIPTNIYGTIDKKTLKQYFRVLLNNSKSYKITEVTLICKTQEELDMYSNVFEKEFISWSDKLYDKLFK